MLISKAVRHFYKALKSIRRFSEDIDLTVYIEDCPTASQAKKRLENATLKFSCLEKGETLEIHRGSITCEYLTSRCMRLIKRTRYNASAE